jgi:hypothetical protein
MSSTPTREVARRVFAREFNDATYTFKESDDERAPVYVLLPTGARANRVFVVGTLTETEDVGEDSEYWQGRVVDPNGDTFFTYAGQYQPDAASMLRELEPPEYVSVVGCRPRPESISRVDEATRDRWVVETAERTIDRIQAFGDDDEDAAVDEYIEMAREQYDLPVANYKAMVQEALESLESEQAEASAD